ncbi:MAG: ATP synthase subunit b [Candidatus Aerophobetes bacterium ADurb.Bin490]|nr:MAG: ATP synthase subunit b [Candidatus Aerophobetes bacterium ADurb.Bin490]HPI02817.1 F0F1 ATP synthase subunit B [Candidatus Goldiibacteriota bacterium]HPN65039.1 F0F1 ATP synthase subunit B [Candidatus Goldiibacteriota bacterium]HRQ44888.1 F0F1 ATP synthase subunit B [Candidatus Goldiibacteriota bacterium]
MVSVDKAVLLVQLITFLLAVPMVWVLFLKPLIRTLSNREKYITDTLDKVEKDRDEMQKLKEDYEIKMKEMSLNAKAALEKAVAEGEKSRHEIIETAKAEGHKLIVDAKKEIDAEKVKAIEDVKGAIVDIAVIAAEKIVKASMTKKAQTDIVKDAIENIGKN